MAGLIIFDPENELAGLSTGDDLAVGTYLDKQTDTMYFTDGVSIFAWGDTDDDTAMTYTWKSGEIRLPAPVNLGAAIVEADTYSYVAGIVNADDYWDDTIYMAKWEGTDGDTDYTDLAAGDPHLFYGNAVIDDAQANFGTTSLALDGTSDGVQTLANVNYQLASTDDVTVEGFVRLTALPGVSGIMTLLFHGDSAAENFRAEVFNNAGTYELRGRFGATGGLPAGTITPSVDTWYHFAIQRRYNSGSPIVDLFFDGTRVSTGSSANNPDTITDEPITIGAYDASNDQTFTNVLNGWIDDIRVTKAARYGDVSSITVPAAEYDEEQSNAGTAYDITFKLYADDVLKATKTVTSGDPFRLPGGYLSNIYSVEIVSALPVTRVSVAESILELLDG